MAKTRRERCVECRGGGLTCTQCGLAAWEDRCDECGGKTENCYACDGKGGFDMPTPNAARDAKYFGSPEDTQRLRDEAIAASASEVVAAPILGFTPTEELGAPAEPLRWSTASRDVLFVPHADGRERVLLTAEGADEGEELELPSKQIYRGRAALSPNQKTLAVGSPVCCRRVELDTGKSRDVLQGPWQVAVGWLSDDIVAVLTKAGDWTLHFDDPDVAEMPSVKTFPKGTQKHATMRTPGMLHVVDTRRGSDLLVSVRVNADHMETLRDGRLVVLRREPPNEKSWGTLLMRHDEGMLTSIAKLPIDVGEVREVDGVLRGAAGFEVLGLDLERARTAGHRTIGEGLAVEEPPPPPRERVGVPQSALRFELVDDARPRTEPSERFDWVEKHATAGMALGAHEEPDDMNRYFLLDVVAEREIAIEPALVAEHVEHAWAGDGTRVVVWEGRHVWEITRDGRRREVFEAPGPVTCAAPLREGRVAVLHRFKETDGELDVVDAEGNLVACVPLHPFDRVWGLHGGRVLIVGHKNPDSELAQVHVLAVHADAPPLSVRVGTGRMGCLRFVAPQTRFDVVKLMLPIQHVWDVDGVGHIELVGGGVYRLHGDVAEVAERFGAVPRLDHRIGSDLFLDQGYIDEQGEWLTDAIWKGADDWQGGRGRVHFSAQGQIALVDESFRVLTPPSFSEIHPFSEDGVAAVSVGGERGKGAKCGLIDRDGRFVLAPEHDFVGDLAEGHCRVRDEERWSLYTRSGEKLAGDFLLAGDFAGGLAFARDGKRGGFLRADGTWAFEGDIVDSYTFTDIGLAAAKLASGEWVFVDREGNLCAERWDAMYPHKPVPEGWLAPVKRGNQWGYVDARGQLVIEPRFFRAYNFSPEGMAPVQLDARRWSYVDMDGNVLDEDGWERTFNVYDGVGWFRVDGKLGAINVAGSRIVSPDVEAIRDFHEGFGAIQREGRWGIIDTRGQVVVEPRFADAASSRELVMGVKEGEQWGFLGRDWEWAIAPQFRSVGRFSEGRARAQRNSE